MPTPKLTNEILQAAIIGMEAQKAKLDAQIAELRQMLDGGPRLEPTAAPEVAPRKGRKFSAAARRRMREAQQRRWAKIKGESEAPGTVATTAAPKRKRKISAAGKRAIAEATRRRWAAFRAAKAQQKKSTAKKVAARKAARRAGGRKTAPATPATVPTA